MCTFVKASYSASKATEVSITAIELIASRGIKIKKINKDAANQRTFVISLLTKL